MQVPRSLHTLASRVLGVWAPDTLVMAVVATNFMAGGARETARV